ncbi:hypothetical protein DSECCO2_586700 [anaerobic digester metagenome]
MAVPDVVRPPGIPERYIQVAVGRAEGELAAVVVMVGLVDVHQHLLRGQVHPVLVLGIDLELGDVVRAVPVLRGLRPQGRTVEGVDLAVLREVRVERDREQAALIIGRPEFDQVVPEVQERLGERGPVRVDGPDHTDLVHNEDPPGPVVGSREREGRGEVLRDEFKPDLGRGVRDRRPGRVVQEFCG